MLDSCLDTPGARIGRLPPLGRLAAVALLVAGSTLALADGKVSAPAGSGTKVHHLDLSPPPLNHVFTREQIQALTTDSDDDTPTEDVMIRKPIYQAPVPEGQFVALPWALMHPLEAWKIIMPIPDDD